MGYFTAVAEHPAATYKVVNSMAAAVKQSYFLYHCRLLFPGDLRGFPGADREGNVVCFLSANGPQHLRKPCAATVFAESIRKRAPQGAILAQRRAYRVY